MIVRFRRNRRRYRVASVGGAMLVVVVLAAACAPDHPDPEIIGQPTLANPEPEVAGATQTPEDPAALAFDETTGPDDAAEPAAQPPSTAIQETSLEADGRADLDRGSGNAVVIAFGGDVQLGGTVRTRVEADPESALDALKPYFAEADVAIANLETAVTERGEPADDDYASRAPLGSFRALHSAGLDAVSMANDHAIDFGSEGLEDTLAAAELAQMPVIGIGVDADAAYEPFRARVNDQRLSVFSASMNFGPGLAASYAADETDGGVASGGPQGFERLLEEVAAERSKADTVAVYLHWGDEGDECPTEEQQQAAFSLGAAGADIVVGSGTQTLQGSGLLGSTAVGYGLGNLVFATADPNEAAGGVVTVTVTGRHVDDISFAPFRLRDRLPTPWRSGRDIVASRAYAELSGCAGLTRPLP